MDTRLNKYNENNTMSRVHKNEELYQKINDGELDNFNVRSNATVIGNQEQEIDVEKIKKILDKRYNETPQRKSIRVEPKEEVSLVFEDDTKEYDLSKVLEKAKDEKVETYEESRAKKLRNTQFDILSNLNLDTTEKEEIEEEKKLSSSEEDLMKLINTITLNEAKKQEEHDDPLDLLSDLKGGDDTQVYESMIEEVKTSVIVEKKENGNENAKNVIEEVNNTVKENKNVIDNSFYTHNLFKKKDFEKDEGNEFVDDAKLSAWVKILIVIVVIAFLIGLFLFLKSFLNF